MGALPKEVFVEQLDSADLKKWVLNLREWGFINAGKGERTLQMWICSYLVTKFFMREKHPFKFRPISIEERATKGDESIGDIMLPSQQIDGKTDVWVEIKNYFGKSSLSVGELGKLRRDFEKCRENIKRGGFGVVLITIDQSEDARAQTRDLCKEFSDVQLVIIGR